MEGALNRRGIFFRRLAASDLEFFEARTAGFPWGLALTINAPIAEAVLPRAAQRRGQWKLEGRHYPTGAAETFDLNRAVDWQLRGSGVAAEEARAVAVGDWFVVQYETAPDGVVSFLWRVVTRNEQRRLWQKIEDNVSRHLVARMAHFADVHPEYDSIEALLSGPEAIEEAELTSPAALDEVENESGLVPPPGPDFSETTLRLSDGAIVQYQYYTPQIPVPSAQLAPVPPESDLPADEKNEGAPLPAIDSILKLGGMLQPILIKENPIFPPKATTRPPGISSRPPKSEGPVRRHLWLTTSASALVLLAVTALAAKYTPAIGTFVCGRLGISCPAQQIAAQTPALRAGPAAATDEPVHTASIPAAPDRASAAKPADATITARAPYVDEVVWRFLADTKNSDQLKSFLSQFPASSYRPLAQIRLAALEPRVTDCDLLAAHPLDLQKNPEAAGVKIQFLNTTLAMRACEQAVADYPDALRFPLQLGRGYERAKRYDDAHRWYVKGAELGNAQAMHNLGFQYATGQGVARDYAEARKWFTRAAAHGNGPAMLHLGDLYANGLGVSRDYAEARRRFMDAADRGIATAMTRLGDLYANGDGVSRDYAEARQWYAKAAELGSAPAMYNLALLNEKGRGGPRDYAEAKKWYAKAADIGNEEARRSLARLNR